MKSILHGGRKVLGLLVAAAVVSAAPGLGCYQALAATVVPIKVSVAPVGGMAAGGAAFGPGKLSGLGVQGPSGLGHVGLNPILLGVGSVQVNPAVMGLGLPASIMTGDSFVPDAGIVETGRPRGIRSAADVSPTSPPKSAIAGLNTHPLGRSFAPPGTGGKLQRRGPPGEDGETSLHMLRGRPNKLGLRFRALNAAFAAKKDAEIYLPPGVKSSSLKSRAAAAEQAGAVPFISRLPGLRRLGSVSGRIQGTPALAHSPLGARAPRPLVLRSSKSPGDLRLFIETAGRAGTRAAIRHVAAVTGLRHAEHVGGAVGADSGVQPLRSEEEAASAKPAKVKFPAVLGRGKKAWLGLGAAALLLIAALAARQIGVESLAVAMPALVQKTFGDFTAIAYLAIAASVTSAVGRGVASMVIKRYGLRKTFIAANSIRLVSISLLAGLLATGYMTLPMMIGFYAFNGLIAGVSLTTLESIVPALVGQNQGRIEKFWTWQQTILEITAVITPIATGAVVAGMGFMPALIAFPAAMLITVAILWKTLRIPKRMEQLRMAELARKAEPVAEEGGKKVKGFFGKLVFGAKLVWSTPALRYSFLAFTVYMMLNPFLYSMFAPAFSLRLAASAEMATSIQGFMTGFYSMGGLIGGLLMIREQFKSARVNKAERAAEEERRGGALSDEQWDKIYQPKESEFLRKSMLRWLLLGVVGLLGVASMAFPLPALGAAVALPAWLSWSAPLTLQAVLLVPFGIAQVVSVLKLRSFFQSRVPRTNKAGEEVDYMPDAMGFIGMASLLVSTIGLIGLKTLFKGVAGFTPFTYVAWAMIPLAAAYLFLRWRLAANSRPSSTR